MQISSDSSNTPLTTINLIHVLYTCFVTRVFILIILDDSIKVLSIFSHLIWCGQMVLGDWLTYERG